MGCSNGIYKKKILGNPGMRRFFYRIKRCTELHYPLLSPEVYDKLNEGKVFSKIDVSDAYL